MGIVSLAGSALNAQDTSMADRVILNARIWTGTNVSVRDAERKREPTAVAIRGDSIVALGDDESIRMWIGPNTRVADARGRRMIPGMTDSHTHIISGGLQLARLNLRDVKDREEFVRAIGDSAKQKKSGEWVLGGRWSVESWKDARQPTKEWIDPATGDVPVFLPRMDGHAGLVNSAALRRAGIDAKGPADPPGGEIVRDPKTGETTGILKESAMDLVERVIPPPSDRERDDALRRGVEHANSLGITSVHNMSDLWELEVFRRAHAADKLSLRIIAYLSVSDWHVHLEKVKHYPVRDDRYRVAGFKGYMDGSLGSRTAYMKEPFSDAGPETKHPRGQLNAMADPPEKFREMVAVADREGLQLAVHAIGDEANHLLLDAYEYAAARHGPRDRRHRIEHVQHLVVEDIPRLAKLGVVASMQPYHKADDGRYAEKAIGKERLAGSYAFRQLLDSGAILAFGSDFPVVTLDPWAGIAAAVGARTLAGEVWLPTHSVALDEALYAYTAAPAKAVHREERWGTIEPGSFADLVILAADPFTIPQDQLDKVKVFQTILNGRTVFSQPE